MDTLQQPTDNPPGVTPLFTEVLEAAAAWLGLPPDPLAA
jgi:hypothetical protein